MDELLQPDGSTLRYLLRGRRYDGLDGRVHAVLRWDGMISRGVAPLCDARRSPRASVADRPGDDPVTCPDCCAEEVHLG